MRQIGIRDLKTHLSEALQALENGEVIEVTRHGRSVARITPINRRPDPEQVAAALEEVGRLAEEIGRYVPEGLTAAQIIDDIRS